MSDAKSLTENLECIRCPTVSIWVRNPGMYIIRHDEIRTASKGNLQTISMPSRANRSSTDTYMLYHHVKFSCNKISPICKQCREEEEREHCLLECKTLDENRKTQMVKQYEALEEAKGKRGGGVVHGL
jgi:hypothetical protein